MKYLGDNQDEKSIVNKKALPNLQQYVTKESINNAGIHGETYTTILDTTTVTTTLHSGYNNPWAELSSTDDMLKYTRLYNCRVTFDGVEYIVKGQDWFSESGNTNARKCGATLGNINFVNDPSGFCGIKYNVPFLITGGMDIDGSHVEGLYLYTQTASTHTVKIEKIVYDYEAIPKTLIYGSEQTPIYVDVSGQTYNGYSIGSNRLIKSRQVVAIGYGNVMRKETTFALGNANVLNGGSAVAIGVGHTCSGISASVLGGQQGVASANFAVSIGSYNTATGMGATAMGYITTASGTGAIAMGYITTASGVIATATGSQTVASGTGSATFGIQTKANHQAQFAFGAFNEEDPSSAESYQRGNYVEIVGNGTADDARSNARTLDWDGNEILAGNISINGGTTKIDVGLLQLLANGNLEPNSENVDFTISNTGIINKGGSSASIEFPIHSGFAKALIVIGNNTSTMSSYAHVFKQKIPIDISNGTDVSSYYATGLSNRITISKNEQVKIILPSDAKYVVLHTIAQSGTDIAPSYYGEYTNIGLAINNY